MLNSESFSRAQLRQQLRQQRRKLSPLQQRKAAQALYRQLANHPVFLRAKHIALYFAQDGEIDPNLLMQAACQRGKTVYVPVLRRYPKTAMDFQRVQPKQRLGRNRFAIAEPRFQLTQQRKPWALSLLLLPLVGFDEQGNRLGMGGGFYDRKLSYLKRRQHWHSPHLIGLAHECQKVTKLTQASWDIPLSACVTDARHYPCTSTVSLAKR